MPSAFFGCEDVIFRELIHLTDVVLSCTNS